jgi:hypothetical protein
MALLFLASIILYAIRISILRSNKKKEIEQLIHDLTVMKYNEIMKQRDRDFQDYQIQLKEANKEHDQAV